MSALPTFKIYSLAAVQLTVGNFLIGGFGEDGGVEFEWDADIGEITNGATGETVFSANNNFTARVNITVLESSGSYRDLGILLKAQEVASAIGFAIPIPFAMLDSISGDNISTPTALFTQRPTQSKARTVGERTFQMVIPGGALTALYGPGILF